MSNREIKFWYWVVDRLPKKLIYFAVMSVWVRASVEIYTDKHLDEITLSMAVKFLGVE